MNNGKMHYEKRQKKPKVQSRRADNIGYKTQNEDKQAKTQQSLKIPQEQSETANRRRADNTMA